MGETYKIVFILICSFFWRVSEPLGQIVMTNLDSILKSRDITLPTKVRLVKAMVFSVVMYMSGECMLLGSLSRHNKGLE